jgi:choline dehydrogenase-like flavoprotein
MHHIYSYLSTEHDLTVLERGMAILTRVMHTTPLADIIDHTESDKRLGHWLPTANLAELRDYMRSHLETLYHPTSTARMAPLLDGGVVDARLRVHGVQSLRVVDASVFPTIVSGHTVRAHSSVCLHAPRGAISNQHTNGGVTLLLPRPDWNTNILTNCANIQAGPTMAVAEKAADLILEDFGSAQ